MKNTVFTLAIGILIGRYIYINYDKAGAREKEAELKRKLLKTLKDLGLSLKERQEVLSKYLNQ